MERKEGKEREKEGKRKEGRKKGRKKYLKAECGASLKVDDIEEVEERKNDGPKSQWSLTRMGSWTHAFISELTEMWIL